MISLLFLLMVARAIAQLHIATLHMRPDDDCLNILDNAALLSFDEETHIVLMSQESETHCIRNHPGFETLEMDQSVRITQELDRIQTNPPSWGLKRISQRKLPLGETFVYPAASGHGVNIYIVDTGVDVSQPDLKGRVEHGVTTTTADNSSADHNTHGTMVAGIAAGTLYGVAKKARIVAVKSLEDNGEGIVSNILLGLVYIANRMKNEKSKKPTVVNLSFTTGKIAALNRAVDSLTGSGAVTVAAAGNGNYEKSDEGRDACSYSPANSPTTITVGSTDSKDILASFSNNGNCTDIFAPGVDVRTILPDNKTGVTSGTSFSAPYVSGAAALLFSQEIEKGMDVGQRDVKDKILSTASTGVLRGVPSEYNRLLYVDAVNTTSFATVTRLPLRDTTSPEDARSHYESHLARIGRSMMEDHDLVMGNKRYTLLEVEAYLTAPQHGHADPYCHGHSRQKRAGYWFFHRAGMSDSFRGGSRKGVDITIGSHESAGGMLIRAVLEQATGRVIEGPSLLVDEILKVCQKKDLQSLTAAPWSGDCWCAKSLFYIEAKPSDRQAKRQKVGEQKVYTSCRVGLGLGNRSPSIEARLQFVGRPYRYVMKPHLLKKGRVWTLFGLFEEDLTSKEIVELTQVKQSLLPRYKSEFDAGREAPLDTIRECLNGKDIVSGGAYWKLRVMSAVRWWECNAKQGEKFKLEED